MSEPTRNEIAESIWNELAAKQGYVRHTSGDGGYTAKEWAKRQNLSQRAACAFLLAQHRAGVLDWYYALEEDRKAKVYYPKGHKVTR